MLFSCSLVILACPAWAAAPKGSEKAPWEWTADQRLGERFNAAKARQREEAYLQSHPKLRAVATAASSPSAREAHVYSVDGSTNPELLLPHELFDGLLTGLTPDNEQRARQQEFYAPALRAFGYDPDAFWSALSSVSGSYLLVRFAQGSTGIDVMCHARYDAFQSARRLFGPKTFDRLL